MVQTGNQKDKDKATAELIEHNVRMVSAIAKKFRGRGCEHDDMMTDGMLGLHHAVQRYDWSLGHRFSTYATNWIRQAIGRGVESRGRDIRLPSHAIAKLSHIRVTRHEYTLKHGQPPTPAELLAYVREVKHTYPKYLHKQIDSLTVESMSEILQHDTKIVSSIDEPNHYGQTKYDFIPSGDMPVENSLDKEELYAQLRSMMTILTDREIACLRLRYGFDGLCDGRSLEDVGLLIGYSRERIRQIQVRALAKLRVNAGADILAQLFERMEL
jgi:RNA polymerase sigma factor (sigma-70 family)